MVSTLFWGLGFALAVWLQRTIRALLRQKQFRARFPTNAEGIILGAESRTYRAAGARAILLLHGYNDSPQALDGVARAIHAAGWTVRVPVLPGHGRSLTAFDSWTSEEMLGVVRAEYATLRETHRTVVVGGLSMGGALACWLAAEAEVDGVVLFAPMLFVPRPMQVAVSTARLWSLFAKYVSRGGSRSIREPDAMRQMIAYSASTRRSLEALERIAEGSIVRLGFVRAPVLMQQSADDNRLPRDQSVRAFTRLGSVDRTVRWVDGPGHVLTVDYGWEELAAQTVAWLEARFAESAPAAATTVGRIAV